LTAAVGNIDEQACWLRGDWHTQHSIFRAQNQVTCRELLYSNLAQSFVNSAIAPLPASISKGDSTSDSKL